MTSALPMRRASATGSAFTCPHNEELSQSSIGRSARPERVNVGRLGANAREAAEQTGRLGVPLVRPVASLDEALAAWPAGRRISVPRWMNCLAWRRRTRANRG